jgi:hypothetical protein
LLKVREVMKCLQLLQLKGIVNPLT